MPLKGVDAKDHRPRRARRDLDAAGHAGGSGSGPGLPVWLLAHRSIGLVLLAVFGICGWQSFLLTRHVEEAAAPAGQVQEMLQRGSVSEAFMRYMQFTEANVTALAFQQRDLAQLLTQFSEDLRKEHEELMRVERHLGATGGALDEAALEASKRRLETLVESAAHLRDRAGATAAARPVPPDNGGTSGPPIVPGWEPKPVKRRGEWPAEWLKRFSAEQLQASADEAEKWREGSRKAFMHAWNGYKQRAWGKDELKPVSGTVGRTWANVGLQILDSLSTMWVMELDGPFNESTTWVDETLRFDYAGMVSVFEITIRALGGLLSAYSLSGREPFLRRARELADKLLPAFNKQDPGFPSTQINLVSGKGAPGWFSGTVLAEAGTVQLEFRYLSQVTGDPKYQEVADRAMRSVLQAAKGRGLVPWGLNRNGPAHFTNTHITFGAMGDSYYEYLLKMYLQTGQTETEWRDPWKKAMQEMMDRLITKTAGGLTYVAEETAGKKKHKMDHLACFVGGMLMYASRQMPKTDVDPVWEPTAEAITETCYQMYHRQPSHLAPECSQFMPEMGVGADMKVWQNAAHYLLRPEAAEAIFYMFYYTGDPKYRRMAGEIFEAIEKHTRTTYGYSAVRDVRSSTPQLRNEMETFFLAETMKYLYLTFHPNPRDILDLDEFVLTTEAHPLRIITARKRGQGFMSRAAQ